MDAKESIPAGAVERTMTLTAANVAALWLTPVLALIAVIPFLLVHHGDGLASSFSALFDQPMMIFALAIGLPLAIIVHEGLHALGWGAVAGFQNIKFGFKEMTPYTHCTVPMPAWAYRIGAALPGLVLGVLPSLAAAMTGSAALLIFGVLMLIGAAGDAMILWMLRDLKGSTRVQDHPSKVGCLIYE